MFPYMDLQLYILNKVCYELNDIFICLTKITKGINNLFQLTEMINSIKCFLKS